MHPIRDKDAKNYEPIGTFPEKVYPDYCTGGGYFIRTNAIDCLLRNADIYHILKNEDTNTAVSLRRCGFYPQAHRSYCFSAISNRDYKTAVNKIKLFRSCFFIQGINGHLQVEYNKIFYK